jgi:hypothetical protein
MTTPNIPAPPALIEQLIVSVRQPRGILDREPASIYGVETRALNQALKRNLDRFPEEFMFRLARAEVLSISQSVTSLQSLKFSRRAHLFTEHGALMAATVLNSPRAVKMSLFIIRAFVKMREDQAVNAAISRRLAEIDKHLLTHDNALRDISQKLRPLLLPPPDPPRKEIGFHTIK